MSITLRALNTLSGLGIDFQKQTHVYDRNNALSVDIYHNNAPSEKNTCLFFLHSGLWNANRKENFRFVAYRFLKKGYHVALADYRKFSSAQLPEITGDAAIGLKTTSEKFDKKTKIVVMGHSSGAQIGALLCLDPTYLQTANMDTNMIDKFVGLSGPYNVSDHIDEQGNLPASGSKKNQASLLAQDAQHIIPPMMLIHGEQDRDVMPSNARSLAKAVNKKSNGFAQSLILPNMGHISTIGAIARPNWNIETRMVMRAIDNFLSFDARAVFSR